MNFYKSSPIWIPCSEQEKIFCWDNGFLMRRSFGNNPEEKALYERNARDLITLWGDANSPLHEYSCRQWSGLLNDFYKARWEIFFKMTTDSLESRKRISIPWLSGNISVTGNGNG